MPTFKPVISKSDERRDGTYLVKIRMIHNRQIRYIKTPFYVHKSEITKKGIIKDRFLLDKLEERCAELRKKVSDLGFQIEGMSIDALKERLTSKEVFDLDITDFCSKVCEDLRRNDRVGTAQGYMCAINALKKYLNKETILASDIKKQVANSFVRQSLVTNKIRSVKTRVALLSSLFNMAIKEYNDEDLGIIRVPYNPFAYVDNLDIIEEKKSAFQSVEQMQKLINHKTMQEYEKDMFIFSFCTLGMNMADIMILKKADYNEKTDIIRYRRKKTERRCGDNSLIEVKLKQ